MARAVRGIETSDAGTADAIAGGKVFFFTIRIGGAIQAHVSAEIATRSERSSNAIGIRCAFDTGVGAEVASVCAKSGAGTVRVPGAFDAFLGSDVASLSRAIKIVKALDADVAASVARASGAVGSLDAVNAEMRGDLAVLAGGTVLVAGAVDANVFFGDARGMRDAAVRIKDASHAGVGSNITSLSVSSGSGIAISIVHTFDANSTGSSTGVESRFGQGTIKVVDALDAGVARHIAGVSVFSNSSTLKTVRVGETLHAPTIRMGKRRARHITSRERFIRSTVGIEEALGDNALTSNAADSVTEMSAVIVVGTSGNALGRIGSLSVADRESRIAAIVVMCALGFYATTDQGIRGIADAPGLAIEKSAIIVRCALRHALWGIDGDRVANGIVRIETVGIAPALRTDALSEEGTPGSLNTPLVMVFGRGRLSESRAIIVRGAGSGTGRNIKTVLGGG